jgi:hypothetical protein
MRVNIKPLALAIISLIVVLVVGVLIVRSSINWHDDPSPPPDAVLEANFKLQEVDLELLVEMAHADQKVIRIASDFTWLEDNAGWPRPEAEWGFSRERWDSYRKLFKKLGLSGGILQDKQGGITFLIFSSRGLVTNGSMKGYAYSKKALDPTVKSLDDFASWPKGKTVVFKRLKEHWYLFHMSA